MGLLIGIGDTRPQMPYDYYYGIEWDITVSNPKPRRIGKMELHASLPVQSLMRRCVLQDDGTVAYYLHPNDSTKRDNSAPANLDGTDGQVMVEIPAHYRKFEQDGNKCRALISTHDLPGFERVPKMYRSAYEATVDRRNNKLCSVVNTSADYRGGNNNASWDNTYRSLLGRPASGISLTRFRQLARNRGIAGLNGAGWNCDLYEAQVATYWLYVIEYANFNCQEAYKARDTTEGYKQGGLGEGVTTLVGGLWSDFNSVSPFVPCGVTNRLGNHTGVSEYRIDNGSGISMTFNVPSYRGIENLFGHVWSWIDGCKCSLQSEANGGKSLFYICKDPSKYQDNSYNDYELRGELARREGYVKRLMLGQHGDNMAVEVGASSTTYFCDYFYAPIPASGVVTRGILFGGFSANGSAAGLSYANMNVPPSSGYEDVSSRLCFIP